MTPESAGMSEEAYRDLLSLLQMRGRTVNEMAAQAVPFLVTEVDYDAEVRAKHWKDPAATTTLLSELHDALSQGDWSESAIEERTRAFAAEREVGLGKVIHPLRLALTGLGSSPGIFDVMNVLGRDVTLARIKRAIVHLGAELLDTDGSAV